MREYERRLPHWDVTGQPVFVTFRLHGSLPTSRVFPPPRTTAGRAFVALDRLLGAARIGPTFLQPRKVAELVVQAIRDGEARFGRYALHAFVVMPNHVHLLVTPHVTSREWLGPLKGFTGHECLRLLGLRGAPFWQDESYDHLVRDKGEYGKIVRYIEWNPVQAGLVPCPEDYPWSSAAPGESPAAARKG